MRGSALPVSASGDLDLSLDIGADATNDWTYNQATSFPATLEVTGIANALNAYMVTQTGVAWGGDVEVPIRVQVDRQADVMLTDLALAPTGAKTRYLRLPDARTDSEVTLDVSFGEPGDPAAPAGIFRGCGCGWHNRMVGITDRSLPDNYP